MADSSAIRAPRGAPSARTVARRPTRAADLDAMEVVRAVGRELADIGIVDPALTGRLARDLAAEAGAAPSPRTVAALTRERIDAWVGGLAEAAGIRRPAAIPAGRVALLALNREHPRPDDLLASEPAPGFREAFARALPAACPPDAPLAMPVQPLRSWSPGEPVETLHARRRALAPWPRPALIVGAASASTGLAGWELSRVMAVGGYSALEIALLVLFVPNFLWIAVSLWSALAGLFVLWRRRPPRGLAPIGEASAPLTSRTAVISLTSNEDPARVLGGLAAIYESVKATGHLAAFEFFVLSGSTRPACWIAEEIAWDTVRRRMDATGRLFYRHLLTGESRKAGNVADFVRRWGHRYDHFLILDADSLVTGETLVRLARLMEANPQAGILQTVPRMVNRNTLFARVQQFAGRLYGPLFAAGLSFWHQGASNYWGHNAMIRTRAFAAAAGMPVLPGKLPFGGHILSHDFVEAALMCRAGWGVYLLADAEGSFEESPPSLVDAAQRDRRWCQGNLQHAAVLGGKGLRTLSRLHMLTGIMSYAASLFWLAFIIVGLLAALQARFEVPTYFLDTKTLYPVWPIIDAERAARLFAATMAVLLLPKVLSLLILLRDRALRRGFRGVVRAFLGVLVETIYSALCAPILMLIQSRFVVEVLLGRDSGWKGQIRDDRGIPFREAFRRHRGHMLAGTLLGAAAWLVSPSLLIWMSPAVAGLVLAAPVSYVGARASWGGALRRVGLLTIPEEGAVPPIVVSAEERSAEIAAQMAEIADPVHEVLSDEGRLMLHLAVVGQGAPEAAASAPSSPDIRAVLATPGRGQDPLSALDSAQLLSVLGDPETLLQVRRRRRRGGRRRGDRPLAPPP
ncbi:MAG: glucans biosynthesis glucosyltransferase MdoH [Rhodospirillales bacterium]